MSELKKTVATERPFKTMNDSVAQTVSKWEHFEETESVWKWIKSAFTQIFKRTKLGKNAVIPKQINLDMSAWSH